MDEEGEGRDEEDEGRDKEGEGRDEEVLAADHRPGSVARWSVHCNKYNFLEFPGVCAVYQVLKFSCRIFSLQEI